MRLYTLFTQVAPSRVLISILLGVIAGCSYALLIPIVMSSVVPGMSQTDSNAAGVASFLLGNYGHGLLFGAVCLLILITRSLSQLLLSRVALDASTDLRKKIYRRIIRAPVADLERLGAEKLMTTITTDVLRIIQGATIIPSLLVSAVTLTGMLGYLLFLDSAVFWFVVGAIAFGAATYRIPMAIANRYFERGRRNTDALHESIRGLLFGIKELKLSRAKRERYFREILLNDDRAVVDTTKKGSIIVTFAVNYGDLLGFLVIGVVAYVFVNYHLITGDELLGVIMTLLYITAPVAAILGATPQIAQATVSLRAVERVFGQLRDEEVNAHGAPIGAWDAVRFSAVTYRYQRLNDEFQLGPIDLEIARGEVTFIVGGNGAGKSTLGKLLSLHYAPLEGEIRFGKVNVDLESIDSCRENISAIHSSFYLFDRLLDEIDKEDESVVSRHLAELGLDKKVSVVGGRFSTIALSDGQRKRLALLVSFLEDRTLYVFDEWAAEQDPLFKEVFYYTLLPALKEKGKAVVVICHDDRYFHVADKLLVMEDGKLIRTDICRDGAPHSDYAGLMPAT
jgi:putative pyoverdin transport system ATP-binding/permease protein